MTKIARKLPSRSKPHIVAVAVFDGVVPSDFSIPCDLFRYVRPGNGRAAYEIRVCGVKRRIETESFSLSAPFTLSSLRIADTIVLPGIEDLDREIPGTLIRSIRQAYQRGARVASICTGAFVLAATGLLDGLRATTHWLAAPELSRRYPAVKVDPAVLYIDNGRILTSAGASAAFDLCLHIIRRDFGAAVAADAARSAVMPLERAGGQMQFIRYKNPPSADASLQPLLVWVEENLNQDLDIEALANRGAMSTRTLHRRFLEHTGVTPAHWILNARIRRAQLLLETTNHSMEWIAVESGLGSAATFRHQFRKRVGTSPSLYRRSFSLLASK